eukprot:5758893-Amphidinium_carterae.1
MSQFSDVLTHHKGILHVHQHPVQHHVICQQHDRLRNGIASMAELRSAITLHLDFSEEQTKVDIHG